MRLSVRRELAPTARAGGVLALSLMAVVTVAVLGASYLQISSAVTKRQTHAIDTKRSFYTSEAALAEAYVGVMVGKTGNIGSPTDPAKLAEGALWVEATEVDDLTTSLEAVGMCGGARAKLGLVLQKGELPTGMVGVLVGEDLRIEAGSTIDGYDSSLGDYADQIGTGAGAIVGNGRVQVLSSVDNPTTIDGDITAGPGELIDISRDATFTGSATNASETTDLTPVELPSIALGLPIQHLLPTPLVIAPGKQGYEWIWLAAGTQTTIQGPATVLVDLLTVEANAQLTFDTSGGPIELYVGNRLRFMERSRLSFTSTDPSDVSIEVAGTNTSSFATTDPLYLTVNSPTGEVDVGAGAEMFGCIIAKSLTLGTGVQLHFDVNTAAAEGLSALPQVRSWQLLDLGTPEATNGGGVKGGSDPFDILGVDSASLSEPARAHEDMYLEASYDDSLGITSSYAGWESSFDWTQPRKVHWCTRRESSTKTADDIKKEYYEKSWWTWWNWYRYDR